MGWNPVPSSQPQALVYSQALRPAAAAASLRDGARKAATSCRALSGGVGPQQPHGLSAGLGKPTGGLGAVRNRAEPKRLRGRSNPLAQVFPTKHAARFPWPPDWGSAQGS